MTLNTDIMAAENSAKINKYVITCLLALHNRTLCLFVFTTYRQYLPPPPPTHTQNVTDNALYLEQ